MGTKIKKSRGGQAVVEYLLLLAILAGIVGGVIRVAAYNWFNRQMSLMQSPLVSRLNQSAFGIPVQWFFAGRDMNEVNLAFQRGDQARATAMGNLPPSADPSSSNPSGGGNPNFGGNGGGPGGDGGPGGPGANGPGGANRPRTNPPAPTTNPPRPSNPPGNAPEPAEDGDTGTGTRKKKNSGSNSSDAGFGADTSVDADKNGDGKIDEKEAEEAKLAEEEAGLSPEARLKRRTDDEVRRGGGGGCRRLSTFELIRIAIFLILAFILFIVLFGSRGKSGD